MKKLLTAFLITCLTVSVFPKNNINTHEYNQLLQQCHNIASTIRQNNDFEPIRQRTLKSHQQTTSTIANRFLAGNTRNSSGFQAALNSGSTELQERIEILRMNHEYQVNILISNAISCYLQGVGTPAALQLLNDLTLQSLITKKI